MANFYIKRIQSIFLILGFCYLGNTLYSQNAQSGTNSQTSKNESPVENPAPLDESVKEGEADTSVDPSAENKPETNVAPARVYTNPAMQNRVNEQYRWTPEDPSFLYETRNIPDHKNKQEFLPTELEKVEIKERIQEEVDFRKSLGKIKIRLPDMTQTLILVSIIIIVLVYRSRARKQHSSRK